MRIIKDILLWLAAFLVASFAVAIAIDLIALVFGLVLMIASGEFGGTETSLSGFLTGWVFFMWLGVVIVSSPFVLVLSGLSEAFGVKPSKIRYALFGGLAVAVVLAIFTLAGSDFADTWYIWFMVIAGVVGGYTMGYLRLGPFKSMKARAATIQTAINTDVAI